MGVSRPTRVFGFGTGIPFTVTACSSTICWASARDEASPRRTSSESRRIRLRDPPRTTRASAPATPPAGRLARAALPGPAPPVGRAPLRVAVVLPASPPCRALSRLAAGQHEPRRGQEVLGDEVGLGIGEGGIGGD